MLYNFYLRKFYEKRIIKKKTGAWIPSIESLRVLETAVSELSLSCKFKLSE